MFPMSALVAVTLLMLASASQFRREAQELFSGCRARPNGPNGRFYECPDWNSSIATMPSNAFMGEQRLELVRATIRAALPGEVREEGQIRVSGSESPVLVFVPANAASKAGFGFAEATINTSADRLRLVSCTSRTDGKNQRERCRKALVYLLTHGTPDGANIDAPAAAGQAAILSHRLEVPPGCQLVEANEDVGRIKCDTLMSTLAWNTVEKHLVPSTKRWLEETIPVMMKIDGGGFAVENLPCRLEGQSATCARLTRQGTTAKPTFRIFIATTVLADYAVMITCAFAGETATFPPVCNNTLSLQDSFPQKLGTSSEGTNQQQDAGR